MRYRAVGKYFILGMIGLFLLCFTGELGYMDDRQISAWVLLTQYPSEVWRQYSSLAVYRSAFNNWFLLMLPVVVAFPTIPLFCDENSSRYNLFIVNRIGVRRYIRKSFAATILWAMLLVVGALFLYGLVVGMVFPVRADWGIVIAVESDSLPDDLCRIGVATLAYVLWGGALAGISYLCASVGTNIYINLTVPFLFNYLLRSYLFDGGRTVLTAALTAFVLVYCLVCSIWKYRGKMYGA